MYDNNEELDLDTWADDAAATGTEVYFKRQPVPPSSGKWEKLVPGIMWMVKLQLSGLLQLLLRPAFRKASFHKASGNSQTEDLDDPALRLDLSWHEVAGKRYARLERMVSNVWQEYVLMVTLLVAEPFRIMTHVLIAASNNERSFVGFPPLMNLLYDPTSIFIFSLQYLSSLLRGTASRTRLLWGRKYNSFQRWIEREVDEARFFRRAVCHAIGQIELRHVRKFRRLPWRMFTFADTRRSVLERERLSLTFNSKRLCCTPFGFCRGLRKSELCYAIFCNALMMFTVCWFIACSIHCIERLHAVNKRHADSRKAFHRFVSDYVGHILEKANEHRDSCIAALQDRGEEEPEPGPDHSAKQEQGLGGRIWGNSPLELFRASWRKDQRAAGRMIPADQGHQEIRAAWEALSASEKQRFEEQSEARKNQAALWRNSRKLNLKSNSVAAGSAGALDTPISTASSSSASAATSTLALAVDEHVPAGSRSAACAPTNRGHVSVDDVLAGKSCAQADLPAISYFDFNRPDATGVPLSERLGALFEGRLGGPRLSNNTAERKFKEKVQVTPPTSAIQEFPSSYTYKTHCGSLCRTTTAIGLLEMQENVVDGWVKLAKMTAPGGKLALTPVADLAVAVEVVGVSSREVFFGTFVAGIGQWFRYGPKIAILKHKAVDSDTVTVGHNYEDGSLVRLVPERKGFVPPQSRSRSCSGPPRPLEEGMHGRCRVVDLDEFSGSILKLGSPLRVTTVPLRYWLDPSAVDPDRIVLAGIHPAVKRSLGVHFKGLKTKYGDPTAARAAAEAKAKAKAKAKASGAAAAAAPITDAPKRSLLADLAAFRAPPLPPGVVVQDSVHAESDHSKRVGAPGPENNKRRRTGPGSMGKRRQDSAEAVKESLLELLQDMEEGARKDLSDLIDEDLEEEKRRVEGLQPDLDKQDMEFHVETGPGESGPRRGG